MFRKATFRSLTSLGVYTLTHCAVDFSCAFLLFRLRYLNAIDDRQAYFAFVLYNLLAFGLEFLIGLLFTARTARFSAVLGLFVLIGGVALGTVVSESALVREGGLGPTESAVNYLGLGSETARLSLYSLWACLLAGIGNAFFHVGGGIDSLTLNRGKFWRSGVFISSGALGLAFGVLSGKNLIQGFAFEHIFMILGACAVAVWLFCRYDDNESLQENSPETNSVAKPVAEKRNVLFASTVVFALLLVIGARSAVGFLAPELWGIKTALTFNSLALAFAAFLGKFVGGFCADLFGPRLFGAAALLASIPFLCYCSSPEMFWIGVALLNSSTAITLTSAAAFCGKKVGFAFGLTTLALLAGFYVYDYVSDVLERSDCSDVVTIVMAGTLVVSALILACAATKRERNVCIPDSSLSSARIDRN